VLVGGVVLAWNTGSGPASSATLAPETPPTPTPRILAFAAHTPAVGPTAVAQAPVVTAESAPEQAGGLVIVSTPEMLSLNSGSRSVAEPAGKVLHAATSADFVPLARPPWLATGKGLENPGEEAVAARWLTLAHPPGPDFVVEAEVRVVSTLGSVCDQTFGIVGGSPQGNQVFGGGVIFPCNGEPQARITDALDWEDGYNADEVLASTPFLPGEEWRTYRFELHGTTLRLSIDGDLAAEATLDPGVNPDADDLEVGLWSQGVGVQVREVTVTSPA
ncbi:MAG: hypothetical protein KC442_12560, partial [Thermomicrobiales bacterium]|nr:hypothetical protein [Thermomicrobiales bacterium]